MNKEETTTIKVKLPLITNEDIKVLDNNFSYIVNEVIKTQCKERELALLQLIIKKQQQALNEIRNFSKLNLSLAEDNKQDSVPKYVIKDILQIIDKVPGDEK